MEFFKNLSDNLSVLLNKKFFLILLIWSVLTGININKAFHIDDAFHLEAAEWIKGHPDRPMSGFINWKDTPTPIYSHNQPPLFFFLIAGYSSVFGNSEISLHLLLSIFTFLALYMFYEITILIKAENRKLLIVLFAFCPAFVVNQNLMTDVPVISLILGALYFVLKTKSSGKMLNYFLSALLLGIGLLIKYSILPLLLALVIVIFIRKDYKFLIAMLLPLLMLSLWSFWNYLEYGSIHIFDRPKGGFHINRLWSFLACIGSVSTFSMSLISAMIRPGISNKIIFVTLSLLAVSVLLFLIDVFNEALFSNMLNLAFIINGFLIFIPLAYITYQKIKENKLSNFLKSDSFVIFLFLGAISAFILLFAPFMATRHMLLIIPFILLFSYDSINNTSKGVNRISMILCIFLGLQLGISDWKNAGFYRTMAANIEIPSGVNTWSAGHWGWQWYSEKRGMKLYSLNQSAVKPGDFFIYPVDIPKQKIAGNIKLKVIDKKWEDINSMTLVSGNNYGSLYSSSLRNAPWRFSKLPVDTIYICRVEAVEPDSINIVRLKN